MLIFQHLSSESYNTSPPHFFHCRSSDLGQTSWILCKRQMEGAPQITWSPFVISLLSSTSELPLQLSSKTTQREGETWETCSCIWCCKWLREVRIVAVGDMFLLPPFASFNLSILTFSLPPLPLFFTPRCLILFVISISALAIALTVELPTALNQLSNDSAATAVVLFYKDHI